MKKLIREKIVFVRQVDHNLEETAVCLSFDFSCEKTRNHVKQFTSSLICALNEYEQSVIKLEDNTE